MCALDAAHFPLSAKTAKLNEVQLAGQDRTLHVTCTRSPSQLHSDIVTTISSRGVSGRLNNSVTLDELVDCWRRRHVATHSRYGAKMFHRQPEFTSGTRRQPDARFMLGRHLAKTACDTVSARSTSTGATSRGVRGSSRRPTPSNSAAQSWCADSPASTRACSGATSVGESASPPVSRPSTTFASISSSPGLFFRRPRSPYWNAI